MENKVKIKNAISRPDLSTMKPVCKALLIFSCLFLFSGVIEAQLSKPGIFNVKDYGAAGNGITMDTRAINDAIQACKNAGGGTVLIPAGTYLTGTIHLVSNMDLKIDHGAKIVGSPNPDDYQATRGPDDGPKFLNIDNEVWFQSLIIGEGIHHVSITGPGIIDGNKVFNRRGEARMRGPHGVLFEDCTNVTIRDLEIIDAANYALLLLYCSEVICDGYVVRGGWDGIHIRDVKNCAISNCFFLSGDDCIAGWNLKNVVISNCIVNTACNSFRLGGQDILVNNCMVYGPGESEDITSRRRFSRGFLYHPSSISDPRCPLDPTRPPDDNIVLSNITMTNMRNPYWLATGRNETGRFRISNLTAIGCGRSPVYAAGAGGIRSLVLENVRMDFIGGGTEKDANDAAIGQTAIMQFYGLHTSNVKNVELHNVRFNLENPDARPACFIENAENVILNDFRVDKPSVNIAPIQFSGVKNLEMDRVKIPFSTALITELGTGYAVRSSLQPNYATITVKNTGSKGLVSVPLSYGQTKYRRDVLLDAGEQGEVSFIGLKASKPGTYELVSGNQKASWKATTAPEGSPVKPPFFTFSNGTGSVLQHGVDAGYVQASCDYAAQNRTDQYGAMYLKAAVGEEGTVVAKFDSPASGNGRGGIIIRNDISKPGESQGYVVLDLGPATGYAMQWDSDGDGRVDLHTEIDGYTTWPCWLKLSRAKEKYTGFYSVDGENWVKIAEVTVPGSSALQDAGIFAHNIGLYFSQLRINSGIVCLPGDTP
jgi:hypothetical protein